MAVHITTTASRKLIESAFIIRIFPDFVMEERVGEETDWLENSRASVEHFCFRDYWQ